MESDDEGARPRSTVAVVIPCYNEEKRLDLAQVEKLLAADDVEVILVNDGSTDETGSLIASFASRQTPRVVAHSLAENAGKAEAVRAGLLLGIERGAHVVGYLDADMATSPEEMLELVGRLREPGIRAVLGSRVRLLGHDMQRSTARHYLGRIFATAASLVLRLPVYDTQCGAKVFEVDETLRAALEAPFSSRWAFDVELLSRLVRGPNALVAGEIVEVPLRKWQDRSGSKLGPFAMLGAGADLLRVVIRRKDSR